MTPARKWRTPTSQVCKEETQSKIDIAGNAQARTVNGTFMFDIAAWEVTETKGSLPALQELPSQQQIVGNQVKITKKSSHWSIFGKFRVETKKTQGTDHMVDTTKNRREAASVPRKINPYELRDQELMIKEGKQAERKFFNWKRRQQQKLDKNTEVLDVSEFLRRKVPKETRNKKRRINTQEQNTNKVVQKDIGTTYISEMEEFCIFCLEKRQQSSSAVMFARLRSNRRYKPGD